MERGGIRFEITYRIEANGCGVLALELNGRDAAFTRGYNPDHTGGAEGSMTALQERTVSGPNRLAVRLA